MDRPTRHRAGPRAHRPDRWLAPQRGSLGESGPRQSPPKPPADEPTEQLPKVAEPPKRPSPSPSPSPRPRPAGADGGRARHARPAPEPGELDELDGGYASKHGDLGVEPNRPTRGGRRRRPDPQDPNDELPPGSLPLLSGRPRPAPSDAPTELISPVSERPTELIEPVDDYYDDEYYDDYDDEYEEEPQKDKVSFYAKLAGELLLTAGMVVLLFVIYEVWITDLISAGRQADATAALDQQWNEGTVGDDGRREHVSAADGQGIAKLYIPALGQDYKFTIIEGTTDDDLAIGPGHYSKSQEPGQRGNFAVAGHRVGKGAPFNDIDLVQPCDAIIVETRDDWYVYRMLPLDDGSTDWASNPLCDGASGGQKVERLTGPYAKTTGRTIVDPSQGQVVDAIPYQPDSAVPAGKRKQLLTLTTCHPKFSNAQRMIVHAILVKKYSKAELGAGKLPSELNETS